MTNSSIEKDGHLAESVFNILGHLIQQPPSGSTDSQRLSLVVVRTTCRKDYEVFSLATYAYCSSFNPISKLFLAPCYHVQEIQMFFH
jgi:hypothetical protein